MEKFAFPVDLLDANEYVYPDSFSAHEQIAALTDDILFWDTPLS